MEGSARTFAFRAGPAGVGSFLTLTSPAEDTCVSSYLLLLVCPWCGNPQKDGSTPTPSTLTPTHTPHTLYRAPRPVWSLRRARKKPPSGAAAQSRRRGSLLASSWPPPLPPSLPAHPEFSRVGRVRGGNRVRTGRKGRTGPQVASAAGVAASQQPALLDNSSTIGVVAIIVVPTRRPSAYTYTTHVHLQH